MIAADWSRLDELSPEDRARFHLAIAAIYQPDPVARRKRVKETERSRKARAAEKDDAVLHETGIRTMRRAPVFTTPNVFPPEAFQPGDLPPASDALQSGVRTADERHCYVCKRKYVELHHFYDQLCPPCAALNFAKRTELADLRGRVALLTGGRVKIGFQIGLKLLRCGGARDRDDALPAQRRRPLCQGAGLRRVARVGSRCSVWICATRRASKPSATSSSRRAIGSTSS